METRFKLQVEILQQKFPKVANVEYQSTFKIVFFLPKYATNQSDTTIDNQQRIATFHKKLRFFKKMLRENDQLQILLYLRVTYHEKIDKKHSQKSCKNFKIKLSEYVCLKIDVRQEGYEKNMQFSLYCNILLKVFNFE